MIRSFTLAEAAAWINAGSTRSAETLSQVEFSGVSTDTRTLGHGQLFVALRGEHFDGHRFLAQAQEKGAVAVVVDQADPRLEIPQLQVPDTLAALAALAKGNRAESGADLIAVTGSSGKTTVREMTASILAELGATLATEGNLNNHIGVPLTLFRLSSEHRFGVIELGASGLGEIAYTVAMVAPKVAILTNAGQAHLEGFGSYQNIIQAKGEIIDGVVAGGTVVLDRDDPAFDQWARRAKGLRVVSVSRAGHPEADYLAHEVQVAESGLAFDVRGPDNWYARLRLCLPGKHNVTNAMLALAACRQLGAGKRQIEAGLAGVQPVKGRLQVLQPAKGLTLIDDSYNANPTSMKAAIDVLAGYPGPRVLVLGAMAELGAEAAELHRQVGEHAFRRGIDRLLVVGAGAEAYGSGFGNQTEFFQRHEQAVDAITDGIHGAVTILVKGSRSSAMNLVVEGIQKKVNR